MYGAVKRKIIKDPPNLRVRSCCHVCLNIPTLVIDAMDTIKMFYNLCWFTNLNSSLERFGMSGALKDRIMVTRIWQLWNAGNDICFTQLNFLSWLLPITALSLSSGILASIGKSWARWRTSMISKCCFGIMLLEFIIEGIDI